MAERSWLLGNIADARKYKWAPTNWSDPADHEHCRVCMATIADGDSCYKSDTGWLCTPCYERFVARDGAKDI